MAGLEAALKRADAAASARAAEATQAAADAAEARDRARWARWHEVLARSCIQSRPVQSVQSGFLPPSRTLHEFHDRQLSACVIRTFMTWLHSAAERARDEAKALAKAVGRDVDAARRRTAESEAATSAARSDLDSWRAKAYGLRTKVCAVCHALV